MDIVEIQAAYYMVAATGVLIAVIFYMLNLREQRRNMRLTLEARQTEILQRHAQISATQDFMDAWQDVYYNQNYLTYQEWREEYGPSHPDPYTHHTAIVQYYEILGGLLRQGLVSMDLFKNMWQPIHIVIIWTRVEPVIRGWRETYRDASIYGNFEYLYDTVMKSHPEAEQIRLVTKERYASMNEAKKRASNPA